ncbi:Survival motor neuron-like protein 1 [Lachnellula cervina]|uniref:Survival motor neuron-like protein 1 n=1 Tax=Lachnellula cervina TaxID=1316786 RepID=A0A7D8Z1T9_9HELO|nr:Survival motor neuron-like protein 1 [Lachnellula cervina]
MLKQKYHGVQARGENVEEVLRAHAKQSNGVSEVEDGQVEEQIDHDLEAKKSHPEELADLDARSLGSSQVKDKHSGPNEMPGQASDSGVKKGPALPQHLIGQVHDDNLKNLLMSWYYAGYYTGLYEGQQQGTQASHAKPEN